ncbi:MAG: metal-dependent hydrolase [Planctomycetes bacterium]|nr:metal-dependent hydrolase [Planctomycetota bacterium]
MDNFTHTLLGLALSKTRLGNTSPRAKWALLIGANLPDLDAVTLAMGTPTYMLQHRGISHSLAGIAVEWLVLGALLVIGSARGVRPAIWLAASVGLLSHPALDYLNSYGIRPWLPFSDHCYYGDMVFIIDPYLWILFGGAAAVAGEVSRLERWILMIIAASTTAIIYFSSRAPVPLLLYWPFTLIEIYALRRCRFGANRANSVIAAMGVLFFIYIAAMAALGHRAESETVASVAAHIEGDEHVLRSSRNPVAAQPLAWDVFVETESSVILRRLRLGSPDWTQSRVVKNTKLPEVVVAAQGFEGTVWRRFARHPVAFVSRTPDGHATRVELMDARYGLDPILNWSRIEIPVH